MTHGKIQNCYRWNATVERSNLSHLKTLLGSYTERSPGEFARVGRTEYPTMSIHLLRFDGRQPPDTQSPHREDEIYLVLDGAADVQVGDRLFRVNAGDLIFVPRGTFHRFSHYESIDMLVVFAPDYSGGTQAVDPPPVVGSDYAYHFRCIQHFLAHKSVAAGEAVTRATLLGSADLTAGAEPVRHLPTDYPGLSIHLAHLQGPDHQIPHWEDEVYLVLSVSHAEGKRASILMGDVPTRVFIKANDLIFVPRFTFHRFEDYADLQLLILFTPDYSVRTHMEEIAADSSPS